MYRGYKIIAVTPAGRKRYLEILKSYIFYNINIIDEYHLWVNSRNYEDTIYLHNLGKYNSNFVKLIYRNDVPITKLYGTRLTDFWITNINDNNVIYIRFDDDICFVSNDCIKNLLDARIDNPQYPIVLANVINNSICTYIYSQRQICDFDCEITDDCFDPVSFFDSDFAYKLHVNFIDDALIGNEKRYFFENCVFPPGKQIPINCISYFGDVGYAIGEKIQTDLFIIGGHEEVTLYSYLTNQEFGSMICGNAIVSHFSYYSQRKFLDDTDLLSRYAYLRDTVSSCKH